MSILIDSSILVASIAEDHPKHEVTWPALVAAINPIVYDHSFLEAYRVLTYPQLERGGYAFKSARAYESLRRASLGLQIVGLTAIQRLEALDLFSAQGVISARIYDAMIGHAGILHGARRIMTLNGKNFRSLFPELAIIEPS